MDIKDKKELRKVIITEINRVTSVEVLPIYNNPTAVAHILEAVEKLVQQKVIEARTEELNLMWKEMNEIYHGVPIDTSTWFYIYLSDTISELMKQKELLNGGKEV